MEFARKPLTDLVNAEYERIAKSVRGHMRRLGPQGPEDLGLRNLWREYASQVQYEESFFYDFYVEQCREFAIYELNKRARPLLCLLWLQSDGFVNSDAEDPSETYDIDDIANEVMVYVHQLADAENVPAPERDTD